MPSKRLLPLEVFMNDLTTTMTHVMDLIEEQAMDSNNKKSNEALSKHLQNAFNKDSEKIMGKMEDLKTKLQVQQDDLEFLLHVSDKINLAVDEKGSLNITKNLELKSLIDKAKEMGAAVQEDLGTLTPLQVTLLEKGIESARKRINSKIDRLINESTNLQKLYFEFVERYFTLLSKEHDSIKNNATAISR